MTDAPETASAETRSGVMRQLRAAGAAVDAIDDATLRAVESVHKALLGSGHASYGDRSVDPEHWPRLPVILDVDIPTTVSHDEEYWVVAAWTPDVTASPAEYLRATLGTFGEVKPKRFILVVPAGLPAPEIARAGEQPGITLLAVHAATLAVTGPERVRERLARVTGDAGFRAHADLDIHRAIAEHNGELEQEDEFYDLLEAATPRTWVTPTIIGLNAVVFAAMALVGTNIWWPSPVDVLFFGGSYGPNVVDGEWWRLLTANYVHFGLLHVAFNMWCLWVVGRFTERLLGNWAFLIAYTLSGIGGAIASIAHNPVGIGAGASGAVFGLFGAILGFMIVRRKMIPVRVFKPQVLGVLAFLGYNIYFGLTTQHIDNFAHGGGLFIGFLCGMLLSRRIPVPAAGARSRRYVRVLVVVAVLVAGGAFAASRVPDDAPRLEPALGGVARAYNSYMASVAAPLLRYQKFAVAGRKLLRALSKRPTPPPEALPYAAALARAAEDNLAELEEVSPANKELAALHKKLIAAAAEQAAGLGSLARGLGEQRPAEAAAGVARLTKSEAFFREFVRAQRAFIGRHGLVSPAER